MLSDSSAAPPKRRSRRKEERPAEILAAAIKIFAERGFAATKLEDVAVAAGIGKGTIYLYFPTKEELFKAVVRQELLPNLAEFERLIEMNEGPVAPIIRMLVNRQMQILDSDLTAIPKLIVTEAGNFPAIAQFYAEEVLARAIPLLTSLIEKGVARGEFRALDPKSVVPLLGAPFLLLALFKHSLAPHTGISFDPRAVLATHLEVLLRGLAAEAPS